MTLKEPSRPEFIALVALLTGMVALSIDSMLPAIGTMATELGAGGENSRQYILTAFFGGMCVGQLVYGPLSDAIGRKPAIFAGLAIYFIGAAICLITSSFDVLLAGRVIQGIGASGPRIVSMAMVRDRQAGAAMARVMSVVMSVFILVPIIAPSFGQLILFFASWRAIFVGFLMISLGAGLWLHFRQPETLAVGDRTPLRFGPQLAAAGHVLRSHVTMGYAIATGFIFGAFVSYLGTSQQIFAEQYQQGKLFPVFFGILASAIGMASILNARLVMRFGMRKLSKWALRSSIVLSLLFLGACFLYSGHPPLWLFMTYMFINFFFNGIQFGNYNALAMEQMGAVAGTAASIIGALNSLVSLVAGTVIGQLYDGTLIPLVSGFAGLGIAALLSVELAEMQRSRR